MLKFRSTKDITEESVMQAQKDAIKNDLKKITDLLATAGMNQPQINLTRWLLSTVTNWEQFRALRLIADNNNDIFKFLAAALRFIYVSDDKTLNHDRKEIILNKLFFYESLFL